MWATLPPDVQSLLLPGTNGSPPPVQKSGGWTDRIAELDDLRRLEDDYDGQGGKAPAADLIDSAIRLADALRDLGAVPPSYVVAGVGGSANLDWERDGVSVSVEVIEPFVADVFLLERGGQTRHWLLSQAVVA